MIRGPLVVILLLALTGASGCTCRKDSPQPAASRADAAPRPRIPPATEPDPGYEARRDELLRRGNPAVMQPAPVIDPSQPPPEATATDLIKSVSKDVLMVKAVKVDLAARRIEIPAKVVLRDGFLEFIAVSAAGKTYESFLTVDTNAIELRLALTLLGLEGKSEEVVEVAVRLPDGEVPLERLLVDRKTGKPPAALRFRVVGFADAEKSAALQTAQLVSLVAHERYAPLQVLGDLGNPYAGAEGIGLAAKKVPAVGTDVTLLLTAR